MFIGRVGRAFRKKEKCYRTRMMNLRPSPATAHPTRVPIPSYNPAHRPPGRCRGGSPRSSSATSAHTWRPAQTGATNCASTSPAATPDIQCTSPFLLFCSAGGCFALLLECLFPPLGRLLSLDGFVLHIGHILGRALPIGVENEPLIVFGLG